jgi:hypothetical protein
MSVVRQLPKTDSGCELVLNKAAQKIVISAPGDIVLTAQTQARLALLLPLFNTNLALRGQSLAQQVVATPGKDGERRTAGLHISHFIQGHDKAAARGEAGFAQGDRAFFQLEGTSFKLPDLDTDDDVFALGKKIIDGVVLRLAAGKPVMPFPAIANFSLKYNGFKTTLGAYNLLKKAYDDSQEVISNSRVEIDKLILRIWNEVEAAYSEEDAASMRRNAREWGVVYVLVKGTIPSPDDFSVMGKVTDSVSGLDLEDVEIQIVPPGAIVLTDEAGNYLVPVQTPGNSYTINVHKAGYIDQSFSNVVITATAITTLNVQLVPGASVSTGKYKERLPKAVRPSRLFFRL